MIRLYKNKELQIKTNFHVNPRDFMHNSIFLPLETIYALNKAASTLQETSNGRYKIMLVRGYINWTPWRKVKGILATMIFYALHWNDRSRAKFLFNSNGHDDGLSIDILPYDVHLQKEIRFLSWKNIMISSREAERLFKMNNSLINMVDKSMKSAGFIGHTDTREKLQMHYRLLNHTI